jgi:hypothetical protein
MNKQDDDRCDKCTNEAWPAHICPYEQDINDDDTTLCNCCVDCHNECCRDI